MNLNGIAAMILGKKYGGGFAVRSRALAVDVAQIDAAPGDPDRVALVLVNAGTTTITVGYHSPLTAGQGIILNPSGGNYTVNIEQDVILPAWPHLAIGSGAGGTLFVAEVVREMNVEAS